MKKFYFIDDAHRSKEYRVFMNEVTLFVWTGKNKHDDACDSLAMLVEFLDTRGACGDGDEEAVLTIN